MRVAPPVQALSCVTGPWLTLQEGLYAMSVAVAVLWAGAHALGGAAWVAGVALGLGVGAAVLAGGRLPSALQRLMWDGAVWSLQSPRGERRTGQAVLMLDLGTWLLVRFVPDIGARPRRAAWLPMRRADGPQGWRTLPVALLAPRPQVGASGLPRQAA